jgi:hypothetical protein
MIATAGYCLGRMAAARRWRRRTNYDIDGLHVMMGAAMAGMLAPQLSPLTRSAWAREGWEILFGLAAAWFGWRAARGLRHHAGVAGPAGTAHHLQHLLACGAMVYMVLSVVPASTGGPDGGIAMGGPAGTGVPGAGPGIPVLALGLAVGLLGYTVWTTDRLTSLGRVAGGQAAAGGQVTASPGARATLVPMSARLSACCDIVMGVTMGYMLITML